MEEPRTRRLPGTALHLEKLKQPGKIIIEAASTGDETAINGTKPWRLRADLLKQFSKENSARMRVGTQRAPPTEAGSEERAPGEAAGGAAAAPGAQESTRAEQPFRQRHGSGPLAPGNACGGRGPRPSQPWGDRPEHPPAGQGQRPDKAFDVILANFIVFYRALPCCTVF